MQRLKETLFGGENREGGFLRRSPKEIERVRLHLPSRPVEPTTDEVLAVFRTYRGSDQKGKAEVLKKISGKWAPLPDAEIEDQIGEFVEEIAELDNPLRAATASSGIDVVVFAPQVPRPATWRMTVSSQIEERFGAGTAKYDTQQREWYTSQNPHRKEYVRKVDIRQRASA